MALYHLQRKQRRKSKRWSVGGREERPVIQGLWVHEVDWLKSGESSSAIIPPPPQFTDSVSQPRSPADLRSDAGCSCTDVCECVTGQSADTDDCDLDQDSESESDSSCGENENDPPATADLTFDLMQVSSASDLRSSDSAGSLRSLLGGSHSTSSDGVGVNKAQCVFGLDDLNLTDAVVDVLRGRVMQMTKKPASPLFKNLIKQTLSEWRSSKRLHEGIIFHHVRHRKTTIRSDQIGPALLLNPSSTFLPFRSFCFFHEATSAQRVSVQGGRGVLHSSSHSERFLWRHFLCPGHGDGIHVCCQEGEMSEAPSKNVQFRFELIRHLIPDSAETLQS